MTVFSYIALTDEQITVKHNEKFILIPIVVP